MKLYYGAIKEEHLKDIVEKVCDVLGRGGNNTAPQLILGTMAQETHLGQYKDPTPFAAGAGICQFDKMPFYDVRNRTSTSKKKKIMDAFGINVDEVEWAMLEYNPLLSILFCRLKYMLIPEEVGPTLIDWANYWKKYYNTSAGKGTPEEFIVNYKRYIK